MLVVEPIGMIRRACFVQGKSIKAIGAPGVTRRRSSRRIAAICMALPGRTVPRHGCAQTAVAKIFSIRYHISMEARGRPDRIAELLVHLGRAARSEDGRSGLTAGQWTCLRFFARANDSTRTPSGFASFQATTRGTASQIVKSLESRGLITRTRSDRDRRRVCFDLTENGRAMLAHDPLRDLIRVIDGLETGESETFLRTLSRLASALAGRRNVPAFGTCRDCCHFATSGDSAYCACMAAELAPDDIDRLCASYSGPATRSHSQGDRDDAG